MGVGINAQKLRPGSRDSRIFTPGEEIENSDNIIEGSRCLVHANPGDMNLALTPNDDSSRDQPKNSILVREISSKRQLEEIHESIELSEMSQLQIMRGSKDICPGDLIPTNIGHTIFKTSSEILKELYDSSTVTDELVKSGSQKLGLSRRLSSRDSAIQTQNTLELQRAP